MDSNKVVFIAHLEQENLGVGYISSMLISNNVCSSVEVVDFRLRNDEILEHIKKANPLLVGFSLIFQYNTFQLRDLAKYLRDHGVNCHFTVGGHYPSLRYDDVLNVIPDIDSVVRFEGELTICELVKNLILSKDWTNIKGLAYRKNGQPFSNALRPLIKDLDVLPFPVRNKNSSYICMGKNCAFIIASRGCARNCSFCSIRKFYGTPSGTLRRTRSPSKVVNEIKQLYEKSQDRIFFFQDDDFVPGILGKKWVLKFIDQLEKSGLNNKILWKISCRSDEVDIELFRAMKEAGLFSVYLGLESGNQKGLDELNKKLTVEDNLMAVRFLKELELQYDYGFMLFDPSSTFESVSENLEFLKKICGDGSSPVVFCKTLPYAETEIEKRLKTEKRLRGSIINPDYSLLDSRLESCCKFLHNILHDQFFAQFGLFTVIRRNRIEVSVLEKFYPHARDLAEYKLFLRKITASFNSLFFEIVEEALELFRVGFYKDEMEVKQLFTTKIGAIENLDSRLYNRMERFQKNQI